MYVYQALDSNLKASITLLHIYMYLKWKLLYSWFLDVIGELPEQGTLFIFQRGHALAKKIAFIQHTKEKYSHKPICLWEHCPRYCLVLSEWQCALQ